jgi:MFS family permease
VPSSLAPLRSRPFALLWSAALISNVGGWMQTVAVGVLVTARTGQPGWTGLVAAAAFLPIGLLSPLGGVVADRMDRRRWLFITTVGETVFAAALTTLAATGHAAPGVVTLLVFGGGAMQAVGMPAYQAMLPDLVPAADLGPAISLSSAQFNLGRVIGPALAGIAIVAGGYSWAFAVNAASFVAVLIALALLRLPSRPAPADAHEPLRRRLVTGARATAATPPAMAAVVLIAVVALTASPFIALVPAMAVEALHAGAGGTSVLVTAQGVGAVAGALALTPLVRRVGRRRVLLGDLVALCLLLAIYGEAPRLWVAAFALALVGAAYIGVLAGCNTVVQLHAPPALRGRVLGIYMMSLGLCYPIGALVQGQLADVAGVRSVTVGGAAVLLAAVVVAGRIFVPRTESAGAVADATGLVASPGPGGPSRAGTASPPERPSGAPGSVGLPLPSGG